MSPARTWLGRSSATIVQAYKDNADEIGLEPKFRFDSYDAVVVSITGEIRHSGDNTLAGTLDISAGYRLTSSPPSRTGNPALPK